MSVALCQPKHPPPPARGDLLRAGSKSQGALHTHVLALQPMFGDVLTTGLDRPLLRLMCHAVLGALLPAALVGTTCPP